jgi:hypothetical protein
MNEPEEIDVLGKVDKACGDIAKILQQLEKDVKQNVTNISIEEFDVSTVEQRRHAKSISIELTYENSQFQFWII